MSLSEKDSDNPEEIVESYINDNLKRYMWWLIGLTSVSIIAGIIINQIRRKKMQKFEENEESED